MSNEAPARIQADNYGDLIAKLRNMTLVSYECHGSYQGDYLCVLLDEPDSYAGTGRRLFCYIGSYGSCSGCDWFESAKNYSDGSLDFKEANDYVSQMTPTYILPARSYAAEELLAMFKPSYSFEFTEDEGKKLSLAIASALSPSTNA